jgi:O-antigen ligase
MPHQFIAIFACFMVILGLFWARAIFATGIIVLLCNTLVNKNILQHVQSLKTHKVFISIFAIFIVYLISGLWSTDLHYFAHKIQLHLPFLAIPIGMLSFDYLGKRELKWIFYAFIIGCLGGAIWSSIQYFANKEMYDAGYGISQVIPTPFKKDHIRFSIAVVMGIWFAYFCYLNETNKFIKYCTIISGILLIIYLHILSVKTGLLSFYILVFFFILFTIFNEKKWKLGLLLFVVFITIPFIAFNTSSTFKHKFYYVKYSIGQINNTTKDANISDEGRLISYELANHIIAKNWGIGVGAGDVFNEMKKEYDANFNNQKNITVLLPHNQIMVMVLVAGLLGGIVYLLFLFLPLLLHYRASLLLLGFWMILLVPQMVEPLHETQYGITIHIFFYALIVRYLDFQKKKALF